MGTMKLGIYCSNVPIIVGLGVSGRRGVNVGPLYAVETADTMLEPTSTVSDTIVFPPKDDSSFAFGCGDTILPLRSCIYKTQCVPMGVPIFSHVVFARTISNLPMEVYLQDQIQNPRLSVKYIVFW